MSHHWGNLVLGTGIAGVDFLTVGDIQIMDQPPNERRPRPLHGSLLSRHRKLICVHGHLFLKKF